MKKKLIDGFSAWGLIIVAAVAIIAVALWHRFAPSKAQEVLEGNPAPKQ